MKYLFIFLFLSYTCSAELIWKTVLHEHKKDNYGYRTDMIKIDCVDSLDCILFTRVNPGPARLFHTSDGGISWEIIYDEFIPYIENGKITNYELGPRDIQYPSKDYIYISYVDIGNRFNVCGNNTSFYIRKSTDGGKTFENICIPSQKELGINLSIDVNNFKMFDSVNGIFGSMFGAPYELFKTTDGWETYERIKSWPGGSFGGMYLFSPNKFTISTLFFDGFKEGYEQGRYICTTNDGGITWEFVFLGEKPHVSEIFFINEDLGWIAAMENTGVGHTRYDVIYKTTDGGKSWELNYRQLSQSGLVSSGLTGITFCDEMNGVASGDAGKILRTTDGGETWFQEWGDLFDETGKVYIDGVYFGRGMRSHVTCAANTFLITQHEPWVFRLMSSSTNISEQQIENHNINVYPNPFIESVSFAFIYQLAGEQINISIYDILGNLLETQTFTYYPNMGELQYTPKNNTSTGVYFYRITIGENEYTGSLFKQ